MISARPDLVLVLLLAAMPVQAAKRAKPAPLPPLPPLELPATAPLIEAEIAGQPVRLTVDLGGDDIVQINPESPLRAVLAAATRPDGVAADRGQYRVAVGQAALAIPFTREAVMIAGRPVRARVLQPGAAPPGQPEGSDGVIGLPLLPHDRVTLRLRPATSADGSQNLPARIGRSDAWGFDWLLGKAGELDVEIHPLRATSVISAAAASALAAVGDGRLVGGVSRVTISFGAARPVRRLELARPVAIANLVVQGGLVRLYDWAGRTNLPPEAQAETELAVVGKRGRQGAWRNIKLGRDVLGACASIGWQRDAERPQLSSFTLLCPRP
ncbi:hypothetical protein CHU93_04000 [Sandarakinorhabdus cyanobacteriorum]|uniref:Uncharacterized protein n=1 Tax=Sandarakinorhabdus cyanobacteriorum TaxID=1981098 RepID=A0A255YS19_9SPHN|nr:hypothetical protein [Sandarakinorhabdus cyanobacteriorum]OYQ32002.1 hypothetical protein CHU93_04000 [Sandarakinorhabdus cyanobacteriorum]